MGEFYCTGGDYFVVAEPSPCWNCGVPCTTVEMNFEVALHPVGCGEAKWAEYFAALVEWSA